MIIHREYQQGSVDWMLARSGIPTASEFDQILTPKFEVRTGAMPRTYLAMKLAEAWQGGPLASFNVFDMDQGTILEGEAVPWYELEFGVSVERVGFITTDDGRAGCSPDGLLGDDGGIEIKCPSVHTHVGYLLDGGLPPAYAAQVHGSMFVTGATRWTFLSYRRRFPALVLTVERDEDIQKAIGEAVSKFLLAFDAGMRRLEELDGGPPPHRLTTIPTPAPAMEFAEAIGIIP